MFQNYLSHEDYYNGDKTNKMSKWKAGDIESLRKKGMVDKIPPGNKPKVPSTKIKAEDCPQVKWMWEQLQWWAMDHRNKLPPHPHAITAKDKEPVFNPYIPFKEFRFHSKRMWRFDFAIPGLLIAFEYEGLISEKSGHTTIKGYTDNCEKYNAATQLDWKVYRYTALNYKDIWNILREL